MTDNQTHDTWPACCGLCAQGRRLCPSPQACQLVDEDRPPMRGGDLLRVVVLVLACWAAVALTLIAAGIRF